MKRWSLEETFEEGRALVGHSRLNANGRIENLCALDVLSLPASTGLLILFGLGCYNQIGRLLLLKQPKYRKLNSHLW